MKIDAATSLYAVFGNPVEHSLSPEIFNAAFEAAGIPAIYLAFRVDDIGRGVEAIRALGIRGASVTIPHKQRLMRHLDEIDPSALRIGAVNTVLAREGNLIGYNTDGLGAMLALKTKTRLCGKRVLLIGAGGAARAIGTVLVEEGSELSIANRSEARGRMLCEALGATWCPPGDIEGGHFDILIQTTPVGMWPGGIDASPVSPSLFRPGMIVMDIVYVPEETRFLRDARQAGCTTIAGSEMFLHQAAAQFERWTQRPAPIDIMRSALQEGLRSRMERLRS
ncbi:shikimate dehydrogenase [Desulfatirhabdium butyrativorans]|uniref:shikimate dehydrogenase n=1 Tax=Desulfatirhabdium butyrativorans TaxID=340467 RepID=UPI0003F9BB4F|nr:shikimate dehydrogenase [Desulfatirhabdium butyrativorans]